MTGNAKMWAGLLAVAGAIVAVAVAAKASSPAPQGGGGKPAPSPAPGPSPAPTPGPSPGPSPAPPPPARMAWVRSTVIMPGDRVRLSIDSAGVQALAQQLGLGALDPTTLWTAILQSPLVQQTLHPQGGQLEAWVPGQPLPDDWPPDDTDAANEYHADFLYSGSQGLDVSAGHVPTNLSVWVGKGLGA